MALSHVCNTSLPIPGLYFPLPRCGFMSHDKIWGQSRTDALNHFSWAEVSTGMLQTALVGAKGNRQCWMQWEPSTCPHPAVHSVLSLCHTEKNQHLLHTALAFKLTERKVIYKVLLQSCLNFRKLEGLDLFFF